MKMQESLDALLMLAQRALGRLRSVEPFLDDRPNRPAVAAMLPQRKLERLPVLRWLTRIAADQRSFDPELVAAVCLAAPLLEWRQTYPREEAGAAFLENYGWSELIGPKGLRSAESLSCGVLVLGPNTFYPHHRHEAEEIYVPLSGWATWQQGDAVWRSHPPGTLIHHSSEEPHAMRTREEPLLAMYVWHGANVRQEARLDRSAR